MHFPVVELSHVVVTVILYFYISSVFKLLLWEGRISVMLWREDIRLAYSDLGNSARSKHKASKKQITDRLILRKKQKNG